MRTSRQHERKWKSARGLGRRRDALYREGKVVEGLVRVARGILDCAPNQAHLGRKAYCFSDGLRSLSESFLKIRGNGQIGCFDDRARVSQCLIASQAKIGRAHV